MKLKVLSLFDGMSCGRIALDKLGIKVSKYFAAEIDKHAIAVSKANWGENIIHIGDVTKVSFAEGILYFGEGQCECVGDIDLVLAGSPCQGFSFAGKQLAFNDPRSKLYFEFERILKQIKEYNPSVKYLLENVKMKQESKDFITDRLGVEPRLINSALVSAQNRERLYWTNIENVTIPEDKKIFLEDIIENSHTDKQKGFCLDSSYFKGGNSEQYLSSDRQQFIFKSPMIYQLARGANKGGIRGRNGKVPCLSSSSWEYNNKLICKEGIRKLTTVECERLQTVPEGYTNHVPITQQYKMLGNGWTVDIISHILSFMKFNNS